jgi:hypothetical protein
MFRSFELTFCEVTSALGGFLRQEHELQEHGELPRVARRPPLGYKDSKQRLKPTVDSSKLQEI